ncbi:hypothetical protein V8E53_011091 [Lactarius tabidus]
MFRPLALLGGLALFTAAMAQQNVWVVLVSDPTGDLSYSPQQLNASQGDVVRFVFANGQHSVTQSDFDKPCEPVSDGFDSGIISAPSDGSPNPSFEITVNDSSPIYVYCRVGKGSPEGHCYQGMVMAINDNGTFGQFKGTAMESFN